MYQTYFQQLVHTTASFRGLSTSPLVIWSQEHPEEQPRTLTAARRTVTASSYGNAGEVLPALITNCVKLTPQ